MRSHWIAFLALRDLDRDVYYDNGKWISDPGLAQKFQDDAEVREIAMRLNLKNADIVFLHGEPPRVAGSLPIRTSN